MISFLLVAISRNGLFFRRKAYKSTNCIPPHGHRYIFQMMAKLLKFYRLITISLYSLGAQNLVHLTGKRIVFGIGIYLDGRRYLEICPNISGNGYNTSIPGMCISRDVGYSITIYRDISCDITPDHLETPGKCKFNETLPPRCGLLLIFSALSLPSSSLVLRLAFFVVLLLSIS